MKRRDLLKRTGLGLGVAGTGGLVLAGCSPSPNNDLQKELDSANARIQELEAPAIGKGVKEVTIVSTWPRDFPGLGTGAQRFAQRLEKMSDGGFQVKYFAAGERVKAFDSFDEVASGNAQIYHGAEYYWKGKHPGWAYFTTVPFGFTYSEMNAWIRFLGGQELWDELAAGYGLKGLMCGNTGVQMGGWFRKTINRPSDLKGLKIRMPGLGGDVLAKLGASPVSLPGGQIYENLLSGAIDATEWVGPWNDSALKLYEAAKYYYYPGMHEPGAMLSIGMNKGWWDSLSSSEQTMVEAAASMENDVMAAEYNAKNGAALDNLIKNHGVQLLKFNSKVYAAFSEAANEVYEDVVQHDDLALRIHESFIEGRRTLAAWTKISDQAYLQRRNRALDL